MKFTSLLALILASLTLSACIVGPYRGGGGGGGGGYHGGESQREPQREHHRGYGVWRG